MDAPTTTSADAAGSRGRLLSTPLSPSRIRSAPPGTPCSYAAPWGRSHPSRTRSPRTSTRCCHRSPDVRGLFPAAMDAQRDRLLKALLTAAEHLDDADTLVAYLQNLGGASEVRDAAEQYPAVGEALLGR